MSPAGKLAFSKWKYRHYFNLLEVKRKNIHVRCTLCPRLKFLCMSIVSNSNLMKHLQMAHVVVSTKLVAKNTVDTDDDDDSRPGEANMSSANKEGHRAVQAVTAGCFCSSFTKTLTQTQLKALCKYLSMQFYSMQLACETCIQPNSTGYVSAAWRLRHASGADTFHFSLCVNPHQVCCAAYLLRPSSSSPEHSSTDSQDLYIWPMPEHDAAIQLNLALSRQEVKHRNNKQHLVTFQNKTLCVDSKQISKKQKT